MRKGELPEKPRELFVDKSNNVWARTHTLAPNGFVRYSWKLMTGKTRVREPAGEMRRIWEFNESLLYCAVHGHLSRGQAEEWLEGQDLVLALRLIDDPELCSALSYLLDRRLDPDDYAWAWRYRSAARVGTGTRPLVGRAGQAA